MVQQHRKGREPDSHLKSVFLKKTSFFGSEAVKFHIPKGLIPTRKRKWRGQTPTTPSQNSSSTPCSQNLRKIYSGRFWLIELTPNFLLLSMASFPMNSPESGLYPPAVDQWLDMAEESWISWQCNGTGWKSHGNNVDFHLYLIIKLGQGSQISRNNQKLGKREGGKKEGRKKNGEEKKKQGFPLNS